MIAFIGLSFETSHMLVSCKVALSLACLFEDYSMCYILIFEHQICYAINYFQTLSKHFCCYLLGESCHLVSICYVSSAWALLKWFFGLASTFLVYVSILGPSFWDEITTLISRLHSLIGIVVHLSSHFVYLFGYWASFLA